MLILPMQGEWGCVLAKPAYVILESFLITLTTLIDLPSVHTNTKLRISYSVEFSNMAGSVCKVG